MDALVTGGAGFIGTHLCRALAAKKINATILDSFISSRKEGCAAPFVESDVRLLAKKEHYSGKDCVFHLAADPSVKDSALRPLEVFQHNALGTLNVLEGCRQNDVPHLVFTSTSAVYGIASKQPTPEDCTLAPISNYAASKVAGEAYCLAYAHTYGMKCTVLRLANIFGEGSTHGVMHDFCRKLEKDPSSLDILGDGKQSKSYLHVQDCVNAIILAYEKNAGVCNIGSMQKVSVDQIARLISREMGITPEFKYSGGRQGWAGDVPDMLLDTAKLRALGWKQEISFENGLKRYVAWLRKASS
jgi:UDP-glucose 4-epimerase